MKNPKNTVWRIALFLLTVVCGLLMADRGENEFPVFACSEALSGESGSTGLLLQQNMWEVVPLLGYGIVEQQGTQNPEEDETTCRTLTTEDLISEELLLPQPEETQQTALIPESVEATAGTALSNFRPAVQQVQIDRTQLADYETLVRNFYAIDANTMAGSDQLSVEKLLGMDMTLPQEGDGPQILIYHTHSQEAFADSVPGDVNTGIVGVGECLTKILTEQYGYRVLHNTGQYDVETRDNAYSRALPAVEQILAENPSIQVIIDLHRDAYVEGAQLTCSYAGRKSANLMVLIGKGDSFQEKPHFQENYALACALTEKINGLCPGLGREVMVKTGRYNQHFSDHSLLIEVGSNGNTLEEALSSMPILADAIEEVLCGQSTPGEVTVSSDGAK